MGFVIISRRLMTTAGQPKVIALEGSTMFEPVSTALALAGPLSRVAKSLLGSSNAAQRTATANALGVIAEEARAIARALSDDIDANVNEKSAGLEARAERLPEIFGKFAPKNDVEEISRKIINITNRLKQSYVSSLTKGQKERRGIIREMEFIAGRFGAQADMLREAPQQSSNLGDKTNGAAAAGWTVMATLASASLAQLANASENSETIRTVAKVFGFGKEPKVAPDDQADPPE
jgi:hypothetical protein